MCVCTCYLIPDASIFWSLWIVAGIFLFAHRLSDRVWYQTDPKFMKHRDFQKFGMILPITVQNQGTLP